MAKKVTKKVTKKRVKKNVERYPYIYENQDLTEYSNLSFLPVMS